MIGSRIYAFGEDHTGAIWVGTYGSGLARWDRATGKFKTYLHDPKNPHSISDYAIWAIYQDRQGVLWIGTGQGLNRFDPTTEHFAHYELDTKQEKNNNIWSIFEDNQGVMWLGTSHGVAQFDRTTGKFVLYTNDPKNPASLSNNFVSCILEDRQGNLWIATSDGLNRMDRKAGTFKVFRNKPKDPTSLSNNYVAGIYVDQAGVLWLATSGGLNRFDHATQTFSHFGKKEGLPNDEVYGILEDKEHRLWLSTNLGISRFDPKTKQFRNFDARDGLQSNEFNAQAYYQSRRGEFFFGGIHGINAFFPEKIENNPYPPAVVLTDFQVFNQSVPVSLAADSARPAYSLPKVIGESQEIFLPYANNVFSFEFAALDFNRPEKNQYAYQLEGFRRGLGVFRQPPLCYLHEPRPRRIRL